MQIDGQNRIKEYTALTLLLIPFMTQLVQCLGQDQESMNFIWQIIDTKKATSKIVETRHGSFTDIPHTELQLNTTIKELPNHFSHWCGKLRK